MRKVRLEELFIGAWVREYVSAPCKFSVPMCVRGVDDGGDLRLGYPGGDSFSASIANVYGIPIDEDVMKGFGFVQTRGDNVWLRIIGDVRLTVSLRQRHGAVHCRRVAVSGRVACWNEEIRYMHELQRWWVDKVLLPCNIPLAVMWAPREEREEL